MAVYKNLLKLARKMAPTLAIAVIRFGPQLKRLIEENPAVAKRFTDGFGRVVGARKAGDSKQGLSERIGILREQVTYLYASATTSQIAKKAAAWRRELESLEQSLPVLEAMGRTRRITERRKISVRLDELSVEILQAGLQEVVEDAEIVEDATPEDGQ